MAFALSPQRESDVEELLTHYPTARAACLPVLWLCQREHGWVSPEVIDYVAERLSVSTAVVKGVVTFYTMFFEHKVAPNVVWVCRTLSCELRGAKLIQEHLEDKLGCHAGQTSSDGKFTLLKAECLAACGQAPMIQINDDYHENLTIEKLDAIIDAIAAGKAPSSAPASGTGGSGQVRRSHKPTLSGIGGPASGIETPSGSAPLDGGVSGGGAE